MQFTTVFLQLLAVASVASALPTSEIKARSDLTSDTTAAPGDWVCPTNTKKGTTVTFTSKYVDDSVKASFALEEEGRKVGKYPEAVTNPGGIPGMPKDAKDVEHFPLNYDGKKIFDGGNPTSGARVFYESDLKDKKTHFLGVWTHADKKDGSYVQCTKH